jgi:hypothetical protein
MCPAPGLPEVAGSSAWYKKYEFETPSVPEYPLTPLKPEKPLAPEKPE